jgi:coenzyme F420-dependent glucose-6-phosphate dehydrogenase
MTKAGRIGFHAAFELFSASQLLRLVAKAEEAGFRAFSASDHFHPWTTTQGGGDQVWPWLGAALALHPSMTGGTVSAPGQRYHPAVLAQAASTLTGLFGERFWWSVGSGEFVNESITGEPWPSKPERNARLLECVRLMRALWAGEAVSFQGRVKLGEARLFGSGRAPQLYGAALSDETAEWVASWADGLLTAARPKAELAKVAAAFRRGGAKASRCCSRPQSHTPPPTNKHSWQPIAPGPPPVFRRSISRTCRRRGTLMRRSRKSRPRTLPALFASLRISVNIAAGLRTT